MVTLRNNSFIEFAPESDEEISVIRADIDIDTADELPAIDGIPGNILHQGSIAYVIKTGEFYVLAGDGKWYSSEAEI